MAAADPNLPDREEVLILIDYHKNDIAKRKQLLRKLNQGAAYRYMVNNVFPKLRRSEITIVREIPEVAKETFEPVSSVSCGQQGSERHLGSDGIYQTWNCR